MCNKAETQDSPFTSLLSVFSFSTATGAFPSFMLRSALLLKVYLCGVLNKCSQILWYSFSEEVDLTSHPQDCWLCVLI